MLTVFGSASRLALPGNLRAGRLAGEYVLVRRHAVSHHIPKAAIALVSCNRVVWETTGKPVAPAGVDEVRSNRSATYRRRIKASDALGVSSASSVGRKRVTR